MHGRTMHRGRCKDCKPAVRELLIHIFGAAQENWLPPWPYRPEELVTASTIGPVLKTIHDTLFSYRGHSGFVRARSMPLCDFFVPGNPGFIVEFDERQHFTEPRLITLNLTPAGYKLGFDLDLWERARERVRARDSDPPDRDEQRAWDVLRDLRPPFIGLGATVRIMDASTAFCLINLGDDKAVEGFRRSLALPRESNASAGQPTSRHR